MTMEKQIIEAIVARIQTVSEIVTINSDRIFVSIADFRDHEFPAVQVWDVAQSIQHERGRIRVSWALSIEIIKKSLSTKEVNQVDLWELRHKIQMALWETPNLGIPGVIHMVYTGNITDLHTVMPHYIARLDFEVQYYDNLTGAC